MSSGCVGARWGCLCMAIMSSVLGFGGVEVAILARVSILRGGDVFERVVVEGFVLADCLHGGGAEVPGLCGSK